MSFGETIKGLRVRKRLTLRDCAAALHVDPSNWSKLERGVTSAPKDLDLLSSWADFFGLGPTERQEFLDLASLTRSQIPQDLVANEDLMAKLPAFFRAMRGQELEGEKLKSFIEDIRAIQSPDASVSQ